MNEINFIINNLKTSGGRNEDVTLFNRDAACTVRNFHKSFPQYKPTPLHNLSSLAGELGVASIRVKDESYRFGLNAFKVLGGSYATGSYLAKQLGVPLSELSFEKLRSGEIREQIGEITLVTATDGNHGRGVAWAARELGQKSVVFMPRGSSPVRLQNIRKEGADASITDMNYDDTVRMAAKYAGDNNGIIVQDTTWEGYTEIPLWIMQGYLTIIDEVMEQLDSEGDGPPTHVFLQAGVGSFAAAVQGYLQSCFGEECPFTIVVEPLDAACFYESAGAGDGKPRAVGGFMNSIMAGLCCGEPSIIAWDILRDYADLFISCSDEIAAKGMRILGNPLRPDPAVVSGESGAVGIGLLSSIIKDKNNRELFSAMKLDKDSRILVISTEGDTDPENYRKIVWDGAFPSVD
ncbi:MAG TPA: diaminopropionate ammonia-lyase [Spirochaetota bacterium]|nr:diaminopropionate ammonia-lyase [Spirochaetota bacterium]HPJ36093.1 diaminopropionate ammonia-lyase [Spirochaetota bacterium]